MSSRPVSSSLPSLRGSWRIVSGVLLGAAILAGCSDDSMCDDEDSAGVWMTVDSASWIVRAGDSLRSGKVAGTDEDRIGNWLDQSYFTWASRPTPRPYLNGIAGSIRIGGRLGLPDTVVYYDLDSLGLFADDPDSAGVRLQFRSWVGDSWRPYGINGDSGSTYWNLRGIVACDHPIDGDLSASTSFSCGVHAFGEEGTSMEFSIDVRRSGNVHPCNMIY